VPEAALSADPSAPHVPASAPPANMVANVAADGPSLPGERASSVVVVLRRFPAIEPPEGPHRAPPDQRRARRDHGCPAALAHPAAPHPASRVP